MTSGQIYRLETKYSKAIQQNMKDRLLDTELTTVPIQMTEASRNSQGISKPKVSSRSNASSYNIFKQRPTRKNTTDFLVQSSK